MKNKSKNQKPIEHFSNIIDLINHIEPGNVVATSYGTNSHIKRSNKRFELLGYGDKFVILPHTMTFSRYYRGEDKLYPSCNSSFSRLSETEKVIAGIKHLEFLNAIKNFPEIVFAEQDGQFIDYDALLQHYNMKSRVIDLTSDLIVAVFFATNYYDYETKKYMPVETGRGYIWYYNYTYGFGSDENKFRITGLQPFKRPEEQHAYSFHLDDSEDFGMFAHKVSFDQNLQMSKYISSIFLDGNGHNSLFPTEEVVKFADKLNKTDSLWDFSIIEYNKINSTDYNHRYLKENGYKIRSKSIYIHDSLYFQNKMQELEKKPFGDKLVTTRLSYRP